MLTLADPAKMHSVGTLMARGYQCGSALVGAIFGTGTNGAYVEHLEAITKMTGAVKDLPFNTMIVNTEHVLSLTNSCR